MAKKDKSTASPSSDDQWRAESDFRTLKEAEMIKCDPERLKKAMKHAKGEIKAIKSIEDLKAYRDNMDKKDYDDEGDDK